VLNATHDTIRYYDYYDESCQLKYIETSLWDGKKNGIYPSDNEAVYHGTPYSRIDFDEKGRKKRVATHTMHKGKKVAKVVVYKYHIGLRCRHVEYTDEK
jgi:hypothetical protein